MEQVSRLRILPRKDTYSIGTSPYEPPVSRPRGCGRRENTRSGVSRQPSVPFLNSTGDPEPPVAGDLMVVVFRARDCDGDLPFRTPPIMMD